MNYPSGRWLEKLSCTINNNGTSSPVDGIYGAAFTDFTSETTLKDDDWNHVTVFVNFTGSYIRVFLNGPLQGTISTTGSAAGGTETATAQMNAAGNTHIISSDPAGETGWDGDGFDLINSPFMVISS